MLLARYLRIGLLAALVVLPTLASALTLSPEQQKQLQAARKEMGLGANDMLKRHVCLWDLSGRSGPIYQGASNLRVDLLQYKIDISLEAFTNESVLVDALKSGQCDAALMSGFRARQFNRFTGTIDAIGALPTLEHMRLLLQTMALPQMHKYMVNGKYETLAVTPAGAAYLFVNDRSINSLPNATGKKVAVLDFDPGQSRLVTRVGATPVSTNLASAPNQFNNGTVDVLPAPLIAYQVLELYKGMTPNGGIVDYPIVQLTAQLIGITDRFPPALATVIREVASDSFTSINNGLQREAKRIPEHWWIQIPAREKRQYEALMHDARHRLGKSGYYDPDMLRIMQRIRCKLDPARPECSSAE
ncbi:hypothetical protein A11A3_13545 [Alcanivorax hongdengensis A-11-3]|uniref:RND type efflux pump involved in aminoglycoside resistance n=1 Tax=Alcanivorax hongdengensis A-11-3 TaxID=1177179 RepID=L0WBL4_9GAMM|nr:putative solute-binding protein [Alcanivorax hongdengensis]EKF73472.1 hypothetical protein A11A3_13545 [Alcanivorax hongdengensis A-11-3]